MSEFSDYSYRVESFLVQEAILECQRLGFNWDDVQNHRDKWLDNSASGLLLYLTTRNTPLAGRNGR